MPLASIFMTPAGGLWYGTVGTRGKKARNAHATIALEHGEGAKM